MAPLKKQNTDGALTDKSTMSTNKQEDIGLNQHEASNEAQHPSEAKVESAEAALTEADERFGIASWQPHSLQFMASPTFFVTILCFLTLCDAFFSGIQIALLTTLEKRYSLSAYQIGLVITINKIGTMIGLPVTAYLGGRPNTHRPRWIAGGAFIMAVSMLATCLPQFIYGPYQYQNSHAENTTLIDSFHLCNANQRVSSLALDKNCTSRGSDASTENAASYVIILVCQFVAGLGYSPVRPLGVSYIDDNVKSNKAGFYIGILTSMYGFGAVAGFLSTSATSLVWVDFYRTDTTLDSTSPVFVSAWWLLFIFLTFILILAGLPFLGFPKRLSRKWRDDKDNLSPDCSIRQTRGSDSGNSDSKALWNMLKLGSVKEVFLSLCRLCTNGSFMLASFAFVASGLFQGFLSFFPKYMESQFGLTTSSVNLLAAIMIPALAFGSLLGGYLCRRWNPGIIGLTQMCLVCSSSTALIQLLFFAFGCQNQPIAGITVDYMGNSVKLANLTSSCNRGCNCASDVFQPVCMEATHMTYVTPCFAGCTTVLDSQTSDTKTFTNCSCFIYQPSSLNGDPISSDSKDLNLVSQGACAYQCLTLVPFIITAIASVFIISAGGAPLVLTVIRSVDRKDKPFAFGIAKCLQYVIGVIPTPVITGALIDTTCTLWQYECRERGTCWLHDLPGFRIIIAGSGSLVTGVQALLLVLCWFYLRKHPTSYETLHQVRSVTHSDDPRSGVELEIQGPI